MKVKQIIMGSLLCVGLVFVSSCEKETTPSACETTTYDSKVKGILDNSCNTSGCHDGAANSERQPLTNFTEAKNLADGIKKRAITDKDMPPSGALSAADMETIQCWLDNGKKEK